MYCFSGTPKIFSRPQAPLCFLHHAIWRLTHPMQIGEARSHASTRACHRLRTAHSVRRLPRQDRALRLHRDAPPRRQDGGLHPPLAARGKRVPAHASALRLSLALPQAIEGGGVGLSARGHGAAARDRSERARNRAARRLSQRWAGAALWRGHIVPHDAQAKELGTGKSRLEVLESLGLKNISIAPLHRVEDGINAVRVVLPKCWFDAKKRARGIDALKPYPPASDANLQPL